MTIYHRSVLAGAESWSTPVQVQGVMWENRKGANVIASGLLAVNGVRVFVPFSHAALNAKVSDVLVKGLVSDVISTSFTMTDLRKKYPDVVTINSVDSKDFGSAVMQHVELGAT